MSLNVEVPDAFSGPMHLLLELIRREEMDIYDINVARLAAAYLEELRGLDHVDMDETGEFLALASRLLEIKSRLLAPPEATEEEDEEEAGEWDPRTGLVEALLEYRRFKDASGRLAEMAEEQARRRHRLPPPLPAPPPEARAAADAMSLMRAFQNLLNRVAARTRGRSLSLVHQEVPVAKRIEQIAAVLSEVGRTRFSLLLSSVPDRLEMVGFFIAMLEMARRGILTARQADDFTDIWLEARGRPARAGRLSPGRRPPGRIGLPVPPRKKRLGPAEARSAPPVFPPSAPIRSRRAKAGAGKAPLFLPKPPARRRSATTRNHPHRHSVSSNAGCTPA